MEPNTANRRRRPKYETLWGHSVLWLEGRRRQRIADFEPSQSKWKGKTSHLRLAKVQVCNMRARRRFHGYCPPAARRTTNAVMFGALDDYTSTLSGMAIQTGKANPLMEVSFIRESIAASLDDDDDDSSVADIIKSVVMGMHFKKNNFSEGSNAVVTSLSYDSRDGRSVVFRPSTSEVNRLLSHQEDDEARDTSFHSVSDISKFHDAVTSETASVASAVSLEISDDDSGDVPGNHPNGSFLSFRLNYLVVTTAIMLADGLQGTHLYVLYEGYGYSVASLYCLGFVTGAVTSPITGPLVDRLGRKKAALLYCALEIGINLLEQYPVLAGLVLSRMVGGITTNLLSSVFETWLDTEYRKRGFDEEKYEIIMRDSVVVSNLAAIGSGYLAHHLAERLGPVGPFEGAVTCTAVALVVVAAVWTENYGCTDPGIKSTFQYLAGAVDTFKTDSKVLRVGIIQGLTCGSIQIFIFLWSPALRELARASPKNVLGLDTHGEPAYGLIFGAFMACGVLGGLIAPTVRAAVTRLLTPLTSSSPVVKIEGEGEIRPMAVEFLAAACYLICAGLLLTPYLLSANGEFSFSIALASFLLYEFMVGIYMPCEGVIRSLYIPSDSRCSLMTLPRMIVNIAVSIGVISTNFVDLKCAFVAVSGLMVISAVLQLSLISPREWASLFGKANRLKQSMSFNLPRETNEKKYQRSKSMPTAKFHSLLEEDDADRKKLQ